MNYFILTLKHKWFVFLAGIKLKVNLWRLIKHDFSKFSIHEYPYYQKQFFGKKDDPNGFQKAWLHHQNVNDHHWEYWIPRSGHCKGKNSKSIEMPDQAIREMIADWFAAHRAYEGSWPVPGKWEWMHKNFNKIQLNENTRIKVKNYLIGLGFESDINK